MVVALIPANYVGLAPLIPLWSIAGCGQSFVNLSMQTLIADRHTHPEFWHIHEHSHDNNHRHEHLTVAETGAITHQHPHVHSQFSHIHSYPDISHEHQSP
jgi:hypothetical protein